MRVESRLFLSILIMASLAACANSTLAPEGRILSPEHLLRAEPLTGRVDVPALGDVDILALDQRMLAFLNKHVDRDHGQMMRLHELLYAIVTDDSFGLKYDGTTRTAQDTFAARQGNCLSFTNLFVALAREVDIEVVFQEIEIPPDWSREGDTYNLSRHVNVFVDLGSVGTRSVDFNIDNFQSDYDRKLISDERALAHYYSNIGAERLQKSEFLEALAYFRKALAVDQGFAPAWSNLGALYSEAGHFDFAEAAYLQALEIDPRELVAMSNLGQLYEFLGQEELADRYNERSNRHRMRNPYYRYHLAHSAYLARDYEAAIGHLKYSVKKKKFEDSFYLLMGLSYLQQDEPSAARRWLEKAERVAVDEGLKRRYHNKLERLLDAG